MPHGGAPAVLRAAFGVAGPAAARGMNGVRAAMKSVAFHSVVLCLK
jgi:hypothetical protein